MTTTDTNIRGLEKRAASGDIEALDELRNARSRAGLDPETGRPFLPANDDDSWDGQGRPRVGAAASFGYGADSSPYTVVKVSKSGHKIELRRDDYRVVSGDFKAGNAEVVYIEPEDAEQVSLVATRRKLRDGRLAYKAVGGDTRTSPSVGIGYRRFHRDPHF